MNRNFAKELDKILQDPVNRGKTLLLHSCCAPCSSYVLEFLREFFRITVFYYNPNITEDAEYQKRMEEQKRLIGAFNSKLEAKQQAYPIGIMEGDCRREDFFRAVKGLEQFGEGSERCFSCFHLRLEETARQAKAHNFDYFTTTLTISPLKNAARINEIGEALATQYAIAWLPSDFKKKNGYKRSVELSEEYNLYRQDYCGCIYSKQERQVQRTAQIQTDAEASRQMQTDASRRRSRTVNARRSQVKDPDASIRGIKLVTMQASGYQTLAAVAKWICKHIRLARCPRK